MQIRLKRPISDHAPVTLVCNSGAKFISPFILDNYLRYHPSFLENMKVWWANISFYEKPSYVFAKKLQALKFFIKD